MREKIWKFVKTKEFVLFAFIYAVFALAHIYFRRAGFIVDENHHHKQIADVLIGDFAVNEKLTTVPGYHYFVAGFAYLFKAESLNSIRLISLIVGSLTVPIFYLITKEILKYCRSEQSEESLVPSKMTRLTRRVKIAPGNDMSIIQKTLQFAFLPILFPYFFLNYTDSFSVLVVLTGFLFLFKKNYNLAAVFGILSIFVRQNNVIWLGFMFLYIYLTEFGWKINLKTIEKLINKTWLYLAGFVGFLVFAYLNGGVAVGDKTMHEPGIYFGNIYFSLFLFFLIFLPLNIVNLPKIASFTKKHWWKVLLVTGTAFAFYMLKFENDHPYNQVDSFLRNAVLLEAMKNDWRKALFFVPIIYSVLSLCVTELKQKSFYLLYPLAFIFLTPSWLIEQRYYLIPFTLFLLFKKSGSKLEENITIGYFMILAGVFLVGLVKNWFCL